MERKTKKDISTKELMELLDGCDDIAPVLLQKAAEIDNPSLPGHLRILMEPCGITVPELAARAVMSRSFAYQVCNGERAPGRDVLLRIAFAMKLSVDETQRLLRIARKGELYPRVRRDAALLFCIRKGYTLLETDQLLADIRETKLL